MFLASPVCRHKTFISFLFRLCHKTVTHSSHWVVTYWSDSSLISRSIRIFETKDAEGVSNALEKGAAFAAILTSTAPARDYLSIAGSSTVLPFATILAKALGNNPNFKTPVVESGGSSVGKKVSVKALEQNLSILATHHRA